MSTEAQSSTVVALPDECNQSVLDALMQQVSSQLAANEAVIFDGSAVQRTDCAAIQFLLAYQQTQAQRTTAVGDDPLLIHISETLLQAITEIGALSLLAKPDSDCSTSTVHGIVPAIQ